ncbi:hypothetical protein DPMN_008937 [Dreissena polymorpha]|uniref:Uncharacterized protein n=1 Tax=Dreissena polymorpha TaxID=45954 RepID=A0A9D4MZN8_DREPO|nr:hypothetical protein DPMN_008937 [Dreissena polymorpha]
MPYVHRRLRALRGDADLRQYSLHNRTQRPTDGPLPGGGKVSDELFSTCLKTVPLTYLSV